MKPNNKKPDLVLSDGMWVRCGFHFGMEECEQHATTQVDNTTNPGLVDKYNNWKAIFPRAPMFFGWQGTPSSGNRLYLCDTHLEDFMSTQLD